MAPPTALPIVYTITSSSPVVLNASSPLSFTVPPSHVGSALTCLARGLPAPEIKWLDSNDQSLSTSYQQCESGVASVVLSWSSDLDQGPVRCKAVNTFGEESKTVQVYIAEATAPTILPSSPLETGGSTMVSFTLRVLTSDCDQWNVSWILVDIILRFKMCQIDNTWVKESMQKICASILH